jgi:hypothetical protein
MWMFFLYAMFFLYCLPLLLSLLLVSSLHVSTDGFFCFLLPF